MNNNRMKNRGKEEEKEPEAKWLTTFNDLMTLLLTFFVLLFSLSSIDYKKMKTFQTSLQSALGILESGEMTEVAITPFGLDSLVEEKMFEDKIDDLRKDLNSESGIDVAYTKEGVVITFKDSIIFESGKADINSEALPFFDRVASVLKKIPYPVCIEGHTDDTPIHTRKFPSNWELSTARAVNVVKHFVEAGKIPPRRLSAAGYGESKPLFLNDTPEYKARNRRVEIIILTRENGEKCQK